MKKLILVLIAGAMLIFTGCPDKKDTNNDDSKVNVMKVDVKASRVLMGNYMRYLMKRNNGAMRSFYGANIRMKLKNTPSARDPHPIGYFLNEGEEKDKKAIFKVNVYSSSTDLPYYSDDEFTYSVGLENEKMVIVDITKGKSVEVYSKDNALYKREGDKLEGEMLISLKDLPSYAVPKESSSIEQKFALPKKSLGPCALSPDGKTVIITSYDKNCFVGMIEEDSKETLALDGSKTSSGGQGGSGGGASGGEQSSGGTENKSQTAGNMKLKTVDFYFSSMVNNASFSPDGKMFIIQFTPKNGLSQILAYDSKSGEQVKLELDKQFKKDRFAISNAYFQAPEELVFSVVPDKKATPEEKKYKGDWVLDMNKGVMKQIE